MFVEIAGDQLLLRRIAVQKAFPLRDLFIECLRQCAGQFAGAPSDSQFSITRCSSAAMAGSPNGMPPNGFLSA